MSLSALVNKKEDRKADLKHKNVLSGENEQPFGSPTFVRHFPNINNRIFSTENQIKVQLFIWNMYTKFHQR